MGLFNKISILFVCLGNICRSPAAEGILKQMIISLSLTDNVFIDSAGIGSWHVGQFPDYRMQKCGKQNGYDFISQARQFNKGDFERFDYIIVMDEENYRDIKMLCTDDNYLSKVHRISEFFNKYKGQTHVPDPYYGNMKDFQYTITLLKDACQTIINELIIR